MVNRRFFLLSATASTLLMGCGFQLRDAPKLSFNRVYLSGSISPDLMGVIRKAFNTDAGLIVVPTPEQAEVVVTLSDLVRDKQILTLNTQGLVSQFLLSLRMSFRASDVAGNELLAPSSAAVTRLFNYSDAQILAKQQEEATLYSDMQKELVLQMLRRLSAIKLHPTDKP